MKHSFDVDIAAKYGVTEAILLDNLYYWACANEANGKNYHDGRYWTYNSVKAFGRLFPYLSDKVIRSTLAKLEKHGLIVTGNYNKSAYDRTKWYALTDSAYALFQTENSIYRFGQMDDSERANEFAQEGEPIPDSKPAGKPSGKPYIGETDGDGAKAPARQRFIPPTPDEVKQYISDNGYPVNAEKWYAHYQSNGWMVGRTKMKDWKAAVRTWVHNDFGSKKQDEARYAQPKGDTVVLPF